MATLEQACAAGWLVKYECDLEPDEMPQRVMFFAPDFERWLSTELIKVPNIDDRKISPHEQAEQILYEFIVGWPLAYDVGYKKLNPFTLHVWELKTPDVRILGWFARKAHFVAVRGLLKSALRHAKLYKPHIEDVVAFRTALALDEPKVITGVTRSEVL
jgi:hypothetical protein